MNLLPHIPAALSSKNACRILVACPPLHLACMGVGVNEMGYTGITTSGNFTTTAGNAGGSSGATVPVTGPGITPGGHSVQLFCGETGRFVAFTTLTTSWSYLGIPGSSGDMTLVVQGSLICSSCDGPTIDWEEPQ